MPAPFFLVRTATGLVAFRASDSQRDHALYWQPVMTHRRTSLLWALTALLLCTGWVIQRGYVKGTILAIEERSRDRVLLYQVNTPIMTEDHYLAVTVEVNGMRYDGEFMPRRSGDPLPLLWKNDDVVLTRIEKHYFFLKRPDNKETRFEIVHKSRLSKDSGDKF